MQLRRLHALVGGATVFVSGVTVRLLGAYQALDYLKSQQPHLYAWLVNPSVVYGTTLVGFCIMAAVSARMWQGGAAPPSVHPRSEPSGQKGSTSTSVQIAQETHGPGSQVLAAQTMYVYELVSVGPSVHEEPRPNLVCLEISTSEWVHFGGARYFAHALCFRNDVTTQRAAARSLTASAVYTLTSGRTVRVDSLRWLELDNANEVPVDMGRTGNLILVAFIQRELRFKFYALGHKTGVYGPQAVDAQFDLTEGPFSIDVRLIGEGVRQQYRCSGKLLPHEGIQWGSVVGPC